MLYHQHPSALVESTRIGRNTRIWAFAHILPGAVIGEDCNICDHVFIENDVLIGDQVTIKCGVQIWDGITLEDDVFVGPNATFTNDLFPRSCRHLPQPVRTLIRKGASIGANATILAGVVVGASAMVGGGAVVTKNVPPNAIVAGNPARITGYVSAGGKQARGNHRASPADQLPETLLVKGVCIHELPLVGDLRGSLSFAEIGQHLPFAPQRYFLVFDVPGKDIRGEHAHRTLHQFLVCVKGCCSVVVDDGENRAEVLLDRPNLGLHIPPMIWAVQYRYSQDAVLLVLASDVYKAEDYIRDYDAFLQEVGRGR